MSDAATHPRILDLPRDEGGLATTAVARRRLQELLPAFLSDLVADAGAEGLVVALDGGVETTVAAALAVDAVGPERVTGLVMPAGLTDEATARTAETVADVLDVDYRRLQLRPLVAAFQEAVGESGQPADDPVATGNAVERFRTAAAYYVANRTDSLVVGSVNRTDRLTGTVTKYGETGVDCYLFGDLYRTEVRALGQAMDVPSGLLDDPPGPDVPTVETPAERLGVSPRTLDRLLRMLVGESVDREEIAAELQVDTDLVARVAAWCSETRHKRHQPPKPSTYR